MLEAVGFPVAVNPETRLAAIARKRGWLVEHWSKSSGGSHPALPIGRRHVEATARRSALALVGERMRRRLEDLVGTGRG